MTVYSNAALIIFNLAMDMISNLRNKTFREWVLSFNKRDRELELAMKEKF